MISLFQILLPMKRKICENWSLFDRVMKLVGLLFNYMDQVVDIESELHCLY